MREGCYVYAIVPPDADLPPSLTGLENAPLFIIPHGDLAAVASACDMSELHSTPERLLHHAAIVEAICTAGPALPVRFGTVMGTTGAVGDALGAQHDVLWADLDRLGGAVELGLTVLWNVMAEPAPHPEVATLVSAGVAGSEVTGSAGAQYMRERVAAQHREDDRRAEATRLADAIDAALLPWTLESRRALLSTERMVIRSTYLLHPEQVAAFHKAFAALRQCHGDLHFLLSGPWPPYSFVTRV